MDTLEGFCSIDIISAPSRCSSAASREVAITASSLPLMIDRQERYPNTTKLDLVQQTTTTTVSPNLCADQTE
jgi:hypothetical protein